MAHMKFASKISNDIYLVRKELIVLSIAVFCMIVFVCLSILSLMRLVGVPGIPPILLVTYRSLDFFMIFSFFFYCGSSLKVRVIDLVVFVLVSYPIFIGLIRGSLSVTFFNDISVYLVFIVKIIIFRTIMIRIMKSVDIDAVFKGHAWKIIVFSILVAVMSLAVANLMLRSGMQFYYQAPAELTFAAALALGQNKLLVFLVLLILSLASGKRMVMLGLLAMGMIAILAHRRVRWASLRLVGVGLMLVPVALVFLANFNNVEFVFLDKIFDSFNVVSRAIENSTNMLEMLKLIDPGRYVEFVSLKPHLKDWALWFGNGYGFRYELDPNFLAEFGYEDSIEVTNAHFTPLAITAKFGLLGLAIWLVFLIKVLLTPIDRRSFVQVSCRLALYGMIVQSFFAFGFFINIFTPFYIAIVTLGRRPVVSTSGSTFNPALKGCA